MFRSLRSAYCTLRHASCSLLKIGIASVILLSPIHGTPLYPERTWEYESSFVTPEQALWRFGERLAIFSHCSTTDELLEPMVAAIFELVDDLQPGGAGLDVILDVANHFEEFLVSAGLHVPEEDLALFREEITRQARERCAFIYAENSPWVFRPAKHHKHHQRDDSHDVHPRMLFGLGCMFVACCLEVLPFGATQVAGACLMGYGAEQFVEGSLAKPICEWERRNFPD